jgi:hypothetical protein
MTTSRALLTAALLLTACGGDKDDSADTGGTTGTTTGDPSGGGGGGTVTGSTTGTTGTATGTTDTTGTATGGATGTTATGSVTDATCASTTNALRFTCSAVADGELTWTVYDDGVAVREFMSTGPDHTVSLYGLVAETDYTWDAVGTAGSASGELSTGGLPSGLRGVDLSTTGSTSAFDHVLFPVACDAGWLVVADTRGQVTWYEEITDSVGGGPSDGVSGFAVTDNNTLLTAARGQTLTEWALSGDKVFETAIVDQHHDVHQSDGYAYTLTHDVFDGQTVDGFEVFDSDGRSVAQWWLADHVEITDGGGGGGGGPGGGGPGGGGPGGGASEWSHGNSIEVANGEALISLRWQDAVVSVSADPTAPDFGEINWILVGDDGDLDSDLRWTDGGSYDGQHHAMWTADGQLSLFDNADRSEDSRVLHLDVDPVAGTVSIAETFSLGTHCDIQGSGYDLADGGVLATCGDGGWTAAYDASGAEQWRMDISCSSGGRGSMVPRAMPFSF